MQASCWYNILDERKRWDCETQRGHHTHESPTQFRLISRHLFSNEKQVQPVVKKKWKNRQGSWRHVRMQRKNRRERFQQNVLYTQKCFLLSIQCNRGLTDTIARSSYVNGCQQSSFQTARLSSRCLNISEYSDLVFMYLLCWVNLVLIHLPVGPIDLKPHAKGISQTTPFRQSIIFSLYFAG